MIKNMIRKTGNDQVIGGHQHMARIRVESKSSFTGPVTDHGAPGDPGVQFSMRAMLV